MHFKPFKYYLIYINLLFFYFSTVPWLASSPRDSSWQVPTHRVPADPDRHGDMRSGHCALLPVWQRADFSTTHTTDGWGSCNPDMWSAVLRLFLPGHDSGDKGATHCIQALLKVCHPQHRVADWALWLPQRSRLSKALPLCIKEVILQFFSLFLIQFLFINLVFFHHFREYLHRK